MPSSRPGKKVARHSAPLDWWIERSRVASVSGAGSTFIAQSQAVQPVVQVGIGSPGDRAQAVQGSEPLGAVRMTLEPGPVATPLECAIQQGRRRQAMAGLGVQVVDDGDQTGGRGDHDRTKLGCAAWQLSSGRPLFGEGRRQPAQPAGRRVHDPGQRRPVGRVARKAQVGQRVPHDAGGEQVGVAVARIRHAGGAQRRSQPVGLAVASVQHSRVAGVWQEPALEQQADLISDNEGLGLLVVGDEQPGGWSVRIVGHLGGAVSE